MSGATDMSTPVTRGELRKDLKPLATKAELREAVKPLATKAELREAVKKLATRADLEQLAARTRADLETWGGALAARIKDSEQRLLDELARHAKALHESMRRDISTIDDQYKDLPERVKRLESTVFPDEQR